MIWFDLDGTKISSVTVQWVDWQHNGYRADRVCKVQRASLKGQSAQQRKKKKMSRCQVTLLVRSWRQNQWLELHDLNDFDYEKKNDQQQASVHEGAKSPRSCSR
jgi:hypothetical protein